MATLHQDSLVSGFSSMPMSLNSPDSKISPHSRHSTNSSSSSRATICTRGCLHGFGFLLRLGTGEGGMGVINPGINSLAQEAGAAHFTGNCGYCSPAFGLVKPIPCPLALRRRPGPSNSTQAVNASPALRKLTVPPVQMSAIYPPLCLKYASAATNTKPAPRNTKNSIRLRTSGRSVNTCPIIAPSAKPITNPPICAELSIGPKTPNRRL
jgi:hypothetical protein